MPESSSQKHVAKKASTRKTAESAGGGVTKSTLVDEDGIDGKERDG